MSDTQPQPQPQPQPQEDAPVDFATLHKSQCLFPIPPGPVNPFVRQQMMYACAVNVATIAALLKGGW